MEIDKSDWTDIYHAYMNYLRKIYYGWDIYSTDCDCPYCHKLVTRMEMILNRIWDTVVAESYDEDTAKKLDIAGDFLLDKFTINDMIAISVILMRSETSVAARQELAEAIAIHFLKRVDIYAEKGLPWFQTEGEQ